MDKFEKVVRKNIYELKYSNSRIAGEIDNKPIYYGEKPYILNLSYALY